jgi:tripeptidyl-peptidase-1
LQDDPDANAATQINEARLKNGKTTIGWVHPTIYAHPEAFHDITIGANQGCGKQFAFNATIGW